MAETLGYGVKARDGEIDVRTVSPTAFAAKVNGLCAAGFHVGAGVTDAQVDEAWGQHAAEAGKHVVMLSITEKERHDG